MENKEEKLDFIEEYLKITSEITSLLINMIEDNNKKNNNIKYLVLLTQRDTLLKDYIEYKEILPSYFLKPLNEEKLIKYIKDNIDPKIL